MRKPDANWIDRLGASPGGADAEAPFANGGRGTRAAHAAKTGNAGRTGDVDARRDVNLGAGASSSRAPAGDFARALADGVAADAQNNSVRAPACRARGASVGRTRVRSVRSGYRSFRRSR